MTDSPSVTVPRTIRATCPNCGGNVLFDLDGGDPDETRAEYVCPDADCDARMVLSFDP